MAHESAAAATVTKGIARAPRGHRGDRRHATVPDDRVQQVGDSRRLVCTALQRDARHRCGTKGGGLLPLALAADAIVIEHLAALARVLCPAHRRIRQSTLPQSRCRRVAFHAPWHAGEGPRSCKLALCGAHTSLEGRRV